MVRTGNKREKFPRDSSDTGTINHPSSGSFRGDEEIFIDYRIRFFRFSILVTTRFLSSFWHGAC